MDEHQAENHGRFGDLRSLLAGDLSTWASQRDVLALVQRQATQDFDHFCEVWRPYIQSVLPASTSWTIDTMDELERCTELLPAVSFELSLAGRMALYAQVFSTRRDVSVRFESRAGTEEPPDEALPEDLVAFRRVFSRFSLTWTFNAQAQLAPEEEARFAVYPERQGHVSFEGLDALTWTQQRYPNRWMVVDRDAREFIKIDEDNDSADEEVYLIASFDMPREDAYLGVTRFIDGGLHNGEPACMTDMRFDDLESFLTCGARHGFVLFWPDLYIYLSQNPERLEVVTANALFARSGSKALPQSEILTLLCARGITELAAQVLLSWLQEDVMVLIDADH